MMRITLIAMAAALSMSGPMSGTALAAGLAVDPAQDADPDTGIRVPAGFTATVVADDLGVSRHLAVRDNGDIYVALRRQVDGAGIVALRDTDGDGAADVMERFGDVSGTGIAIHDGYLYFGGDTQVVRWRLSDALVPDGAPEPIAGGFVAQRAHAAKTLAFDGAGHLYVNVGVPSNACQEKIRTRGSPGRQPCDELERHGGIWQFDAARAGQDQVADGRLYTTGIRHAVAIAWNPVADSLYLAMHGRDQFSQLFPEMYDDRANAELPAEEFHRIGRGANLGWPYTYYDHLRGQRMVAPEYGGDRQTPADNPAYQDPLVAFPGHWAPNALMFYTGDMFPEAARGGAFIAFHGSWNRAPLPQGGYNVVFQPLDARGDPSGDWVVFADGFAGADPLNSPRDAQYRPTGLAQGPDGALYVSSTVGGGRIWRISYEGR